ncbi:uncharacterized protein LOC126833447 isoform X1 [Adelges cooleyi]|uniref:uncharacterized protein LOC126833447 isoform X1 n=1 Tax=Adelges cooleyi TaxID=133065 RepID=UPI00217FB9DB|nr:uncharacterized protein LOC126833447 isoform X1 [Adelges cooleyi]
MTTVYSAVVIATAILCVKVAAYPTTVERVTGDSNYLPLRNASPRDLQRFIDVCGDGEDCLKTLTMDKRGTLDRLNGGHLVRTRSWPSTLDASDKRMSKEDKSDSDPPMDLTGTLDRLGGTILFVRKPFRMGGGRYVKYTVQNRNKYKMPFKHSWRNDQLVESDTSASGGYGEDYYGVLSGAYDDITEGCENCLPRNAPSSYASN